MELLKKKFSPLSFLSAVGAGGISIIPFAFLNYVIPHPKGLVIYDHIASANYSGMINILFYFFYAIMLVFAFLHFALISYLFIKFVKSKINGSLKEECKNPMENSVYLVPFIAVSMSMNVLIGPIRFFTPALSDNFQSLMIPALVFWLILAILFVVVELRFLKLAFQKKIELDKVGFSWLLDVFTASMIAVTGAGIAALAGNSTVAHIAAFISFMLATMAVFLFLVKIVLVFQKHFADNELPEKRFLPGFLNVIPSITLLSITFFRLGHYAEKQFGVHLDAFFIFVVLGAFVFETWYMLFGLNLLKDYFKKHHFQKEYYIPQWALICPFVAYGVLSSFVYSVFVQSLIFPIIAVIMLLIAVVLFFDLLIKFIKCDKFRRGINCE